MKRMMLIMTITSMMLMSSVNAQSSMGGARANKKIELALNCMFDSSNYVAINPEFMLKFREDTIGDGRPYTLTKCIVVSVSETKKIRVNGFDSKQPCYDLVVVPLSYGIGDPKNYIMCRITPYFKASNGWTDSFLLALSGQLIDISGMKLYNYMLYDKCTKSGVKPGKALVGTCNTLCPVTNISLCD